MKLIQASFSKCVLMVGLLACSSILVASSFAMSTGEPTRKVGWEVKQHTQAEWVGQQWVGQRSEHMSDLKDKLKLNPQQEATWNSFARASKAGMYSMGGDRKATRGEFEKLKTPPRLDKRLAMSDIRRAKMLERSRATKAFYAQLSPQQKAVFDAEAKPNRHWSQGGHRHQT